MRSISENISLAIVNKENKKNSIFFDFYFFIFLFLFTLGSHYFYNLGLALFQVLGVVFAYPLFKSHSLNMRSFRLHLLLFFFLYSFLVGAYLAAFTGSRLFLASKLTLPIFFYLWLCFSAVIFSLYPQSFHSALKKVIWTHIFLFSFQLIWFLVTLDVIDYLEPLTGEPQRAIGGDFSVSFLPSFIRATGAYNEPGTYSTWMMVLLLLYKENARRIGESSSGNIMEWAVVGTVLLSFSTFGFVFALIYIGVALLHKRPSILTIFLVLLAVSPILYFAFDVVEQKLSLGAGESGVGFRFQAMELYFSNLTVPKLIFGLGIFSDFFARADNELVFQDVGLWFVLLTNVGIFGLIPLILYLFISVPRNLISITLVLVLMLSKFVLTYALVWVVLSYFLWASTSDRRKEN